LGSTGLPEKERADRITTPNQLKRKYLNYHSTTEAEDQNMSLEEKFNQFFAYLESKDFYGDPDLEDKAESLGRECDEAQEEIDQSEELIQEAYNSRHGRVWF
jgi:hypothetical protein